MKILDLNELNPGPVQPPVQPLLITGANGTLGRAFQRICAIRGIETVALGRKELDITDPQSVERVLTQYNPWAVVNTAGYVKVDEAETDFARCYRENTTGPAILAAACAYRDIPFLTFSSDLVFDGNKSAAYVESDLPRPLNVYGNSKRLAEKDVLHCMSKALVVRTSAFFGPWDDYNFVYHALKAGHQKQAFEAADDVLISPTYVPDLVNVSLDLLIDEECGVWHLANQGSFTWADLARLAADMGGMDTSFVVPKSMRTFGLPAARPVYSVLGSKQGNLLPSVEHRLHGCVHEMLHVLRTTPEEPMAVAS
ncbi:SDR family oxidoreductase [Hymenobacter chitinivorans]|uniref:dTDP-4-dehydrorhamnose reductase n=1 Tax=Hymenobacter chitinivorans DSM 11115 TaxID=1121954 RepID=A0A2M9B9V0_9BACT|nr:SDR family oxidoreductase [Hymenobacter chitinivorans]PJJ54716.1 dTDP-4-dehydrorhamnose reductase [Hymenobacter chitinivorans DSM 11115]